jgi:DNA-binding MurR/RpiR family transcriptional regulator
MLTDPEGRENMQVRDRIEALSDELTAAERRLSTLILADYPFAGLAPIQELAERGNTSPPTISRFVTKLGFQGYQNFQRHLIGELREGQRSPVDLQKTARPIRGAYLGEFVDRAGALLSEMCLTVPEAQFERVCALIADRRTNVFAVGGRVSDTLVQYMVRHLRQLRGRVYPLSVDPEAWPEYLLRMRAGDVLLLADFRRYQPNLERLARRARERGARVIVVTDTWMSPAARHAVEVLAVPIENGTLWDSYAPAVALFEAIATRTAECGWDTSRRRIEAWDSLRDIATEHRADPDTEPPAAAAAPDADA